MGKVFGIHEVELREGVDEAAFERFLTKELNPACRDLSARIPGGEIHILKADRGERLGRYALITEYDSVEVADAYFPSHHVASDKFQGWQEAHGTVWAKLWDVFLSPTSGHVFSRYVAKGE